MEARKRDDGEALGGGARHASRGPAVIELVLRDARARASGVLLLACLTIAIAAACAPADGSGPIVGGPKHDDPSAQPGEPTTPAPDASFDPIEAGEFADGGSNEVPATPIGDASAGPADGDAGDADAGDARANDGGDARLEDALDACRESGCDGGEDT
jgi:hypothetical protein